MQGFKQQGISSKGFTLIELIISIGLIGILITMSFSVFNFTSSVWNQVSGEDDFLLQGRFAISYIKEDIIEVSSNIKSTEIVSLKDYLPENFYYNKTLGFFIIKDEGLSYKHIFYKVENEILTRVTFSSPNKLPKKVPSVTTHNPILESVSSVNETFYDKERDLLCLIIKTQDKLKDKEYTFMETLYLKDDLNEGGYNWKERDFPHYLFLL